VLDALAITGHFLDRDLLEGRNRDLLSVRERLVGRLKRAVA
jgi:DNA repair protein RecO (recombination protein O)